MSWFWPSCGTCGSAVVPGIAHICKPKRVSELPHILVDMPDADDPRFNRSTPSLQPQHPLPRREHDPRSAGQVVRCHTQRILRRPNNAEHTYGVMRLILTLDPDCRKEVLVAALSHDLGEGRTGDLPYPAKNDMGNARTAVDALEHEAIADMVNYWMLPRPPSLHNAERELLKYCDYMELAEMAMEETECGNRHAQPVLENCTQEMDRRFPQLTEDQQVRATQYWDKRGRQHRRAMGEAL